MTLVRLDIFQRSVHELLTVTEQTVPSLSMGLAAMEMVITAQVASDDWPNYHQSPGARNKPQHTIHYTLAKRD
jgi:hypothetical protein